MLCGGGGHKESDFWERFNGCYRAEEDVLVKWHAQAPGKKDYYNEKQVRDASAPFIKWLTEAEEEP